MNLGKDQLTGLCYRWVLLIIHSLVRMSYQCNNEMKRAACITGGIQKEKTKLQNSFCTFFWKQNESKMKNSENERVGYYIYS